jgi:RNA polymerase sigma-70 factor (ECF subfamily)
MSTEQTEDGDVLVERAARGDAVAMGALFAQYRPRLRMLVSLRLDRRLQGRIDPSDVLQEAYLDVSGRIGRYAANPRMPLFLWLRFLTIQRLMIFHRRHLRTKMRAGEGEVSLDRSGPAASSASIAAHLTGGLTSPTEAAIRAELCVRVREALESMDAIDREVLVLRHFEELSNSETAQVLRIGRGAASNRYFRALKRLQALLGPPGEGRVVRNGAGR